MNKKVVIGLTIGAVIFMLACFGFFVFILFARGNKNITISFDSDGGDIVEKMVIKKGEKIKLPRVSKEGYKFDGWYLDGEKVNNKTTYDKSVTLKAKWTKKEETKKDDNEKDDNKKEDNKKEEVKKTFTVFFDSNGGTKVNNVVVECGKELSLPKAPTRTGYNFIAWVDKNEVPVLEGALLSCEDVKLKANWEKIEEKKEEKKEDPKKEDNKEENKPIEPTGISLDKESYDLIITKTGTMVATVSPSNATDKTVIWSSSDESIVTVDNTGKITGKGIGSATITVKTTNGKSASAIVYSDVESITIKADRTLIHYNGNKSATITATVTPSVTLKNETYQWSALESTGQNGLTTFSPNGSTGVLTARSSLLPGNSTVQLTIGRKSSSKLTVVVEQNLSLYDCQGYVSSGSTVNISASMKVKWNVTSPKDVSITDTKVTDTKYSARLQKAAGLGYGEQGHMTVRAITEAGQLKDCVLTIG